MPILHSHTSPFKSMIDKRTKTIIIRSWQEVHLTQHNDRGPLYHFDTFIAFWYPIYGYAARGAESLGVKHLQT